MSEERPGRDAHAKPSVARVRRRSRWRGILLGMVILVCGAAIGAGGGSIVTQKTSRQRMWDVYRHPHRAPEYLAKRLARDLDLSPRQADQVKLIVTRRMGAVRKILDQTRPLRDEQYELMGKEVADVLTAEQASAWRDRFGRIIQSRPSSRRSSDKSSHGDSRKRDDDDSRDHGSDGGSGDKDRGR